MWYTYAYNNVTGLGGGILPPLPKTNNQIATPPEAEQLKEQAILKHRMPLPPEKKSLQLKLQEKHTNGFLGGIPRASELEGVNPESAIEDQYLSGVGIEGKTGQGYESQRM